MDNPDRRVYQWQVTSNGAAHTIRGQMGHTIDQHVGDQVTTTGHYDMHTVGVRETDSGWEGTAIATPVGDGTYLFNDSTHTPTSPPGSSPTPLTIEQYHNTLMDNLINGPGPDLDDRW